MKTHLFVPLFLQVALILLAGAAGTSPVAGNPAINQLPSALLPGTTTRVSVASDGMQGNSQSTFPFISADGRYVAFESDASNLVPGDTNDLSDVFVHDQQTGQTTLVSVASDGTQGNHRSLSPSLSADGRYVAFDSAANNLVLGDTNSSVDVFVHDRQTGQTSRVSVASDGTQANGSSSRPSISADGRYVTFESGASNLVPGDTNNKQDVFVHDRQTGETSRVSVASDGTQGNYGGESPSISADGRYVTFRSWASNLVPGDTNGMSDIFVHDRQTGQTTIVSVASDGTQGNGNPQYPSISAHGRYVAFSSLASNLVLGDTNDRWDVFVHDRQTGQTSRVSVASDGTQGNSGSGFFGLSISADGRYVAFDSGASNLVLGDTNNRDDVFVHDRQTGQTGRVSVASAGTQGNGWSYSPSISADGRFVAFESTASNLVPGDTNSMRDVFVHEREVEISVMVTANEEATLTYADAEGLTTTINIPAGAVISDTLLVYTPLDEVELPSGFQFAGRAFELTAYQSGIAQPRFTFLQPVNVSLTYSSEQVAGLQEDALGLQVWHGEDWLDAAQTCSPASTYVRNVASNVLSVDICHLSRFALVGPQGFSIYLPLVVRPMQP
jgi:Tol biopolymer transport system component